MRLPWPLIGTRSIGRFTRADYWVWRGRWGRIWNVSSIVSLLVGAIVIVIACCHIMFSFFYQPTNNWTDCVRCGVLRNYNENNPPFPADSRCSSPKSDAQ
jgi:hypothetical protein